MYKYYNKASRDNGNVQSHDQEECKLDSIIITNSGADTLTDDKIIKNACNKNNVGIIKKKKLYLIKTLLLGCVE